ncbi:hypothetical protein [uncultured Fibrella sp.]|uniref:hypothetical protein n=1 Tax=uncultured Fibrella sp. TaxID=1284596 RepID=UPI0035CACE48
MTLFEFNETRILQFTQRTGQTKAQAMAQIMKAYGEECNQQAVNDLIDPVVDEALRSHNRPKP